MGWTVAAALLMSPSVVAPAAAASDEIAGRAQVVDGDTIAVDGTDERIRLYGIDAPEEKQTCGDANGKRYLCGSRSADALAAIVGRNGRVSCEETDRDRYGRIVATCSVNGRDINEEMVRLGWALEFPKYSDGRYARTQTEAQAAKRGLWAGSFVSPWDWRQGERKANAPAGRATTGCDIKGNISASGRIFHVPGQEHYSRTTIDEGVGERWFCTEQEASAAGWRKAR